MLCDAKRMTNIDQQSTYDHFFFRLLGSLRGGVGAHPRPPLTSAGGGRAQAPSSSQPHTPHFVSASSALLISYVKVLIKKAKKAYTYCRGVSGLDQISYSIILLKKQIDSEKYKRRTLLTGRAISSGGICMWDKSLPGNMEWTIGNTGQIFCPKHLGEGGEQQQNPN